jgi:NAD(P)-dependent dehydrogenase (short-subunit alcohol dehydrogenase family)
MAAPDLRRLYDLTDRVAIITGGSRGLGLEMARGFAAAGAKVVIASRKVGACEEAVEVIRAEGGEAFAVGCHAGEVEQVQALVAKTIERYGRLDILVNNAANPLAFTLETATEAAFDKSFSANAKGPLFLMQAAWPHLKVSPSATDPDKGGASVINVTTVGAYSGVATTFGYGASKAALSHLTRSAAKFGALDRIRVNAIAPGPFATQMVTTGGEAFITKAGDMCAQKRCADPSEIVGPALMLASDAGSFVTGTVLHVDGGQTA